MYPRVAIATIRSRWEFRGFQTGTRIYKLQLQACMQEAQEHRALVQTALHLTVIYQYVQCSSHKVVNTKLQKDFCQVTTVTMIHFTPLMKKKQSTRQVPWRFHACQHQYLKDHGQLDYMFKINVGSYITSYIQCMHVQLVVKTIQLASYSQTIIIAIYFYSYVPLGACHLIQYFYNQLLASYIILYKYSLIATPGPQL